MFRAVKYYLMTRVYQKAKGNLIVVLLSLMALIIVTMLFGDLIAVTGEGSRYVLVGAKWIVILSLLALIVYHLGRIVRVLPFAGEEPARSSDPRKTKLIEKERLVSRSERIFEKYRNTIKQGVKE